MNTSYAVAWWDRDDPSDENDRGHVAWVESVGSDGETVTVSEYNWSPRLEYNTRSLSPADDDYPDAFLYFITDSFLECDLTGLCNGESNEILAYTTGDGGFGSGSGIENSSNDGTSDNNSTNQTNINLDFDILDPTTGTEFKAEHGATLAKGQTVRLNAKLSVSGDDVDNWVDGHSKIETDFYVSYYNGPWTKISREYTKVENLKKGDKIANIVSCFF